MQHHINGTSAPYSDTQFTNANTRDRTSLARVFLQARNEPLLYTPEKWWTWSEGVYVHIPEHQIKSEVFHFLNETARLTPRSSILEPSRHNVAELVSALEALTYGDVPTHGWINGSHGPDPAEILHVANGLLHLPTRQLLDPTPSFFSVSKTAYSYDPAPAPPQTFFSFLSSLDMEPTELDFLQEVVGYCLISGNPRQKAILMVGPARAGKGVLERLIRKLLGDTAVAALRPRADDRFSLEHLIGKRLAVVPDLRLGARAAADFVHDLLTLTGHDAVHVPRKFQTAYSGPLPVTVLITSNEVPELPDRGNAIATRLWPVLFTRSYHNCEDSELEDKLHKELPGILGWALDGYDRIRQREQFELPPTSLALIDKVRTQASPIADFVNDYCVLRAEADIPKKALFLAWSDHCSAHDVSPGTPSEFGRNLMAAFPRVSTSRRRHQSQRTHCYVGICLK